MAESLGLGAALSSPFGGGLLTGKYRSSAEGRLSDLGMVIHTESTGQKTAVVDTVLAIAEETGVTPAQVAVAWVRERAARSVATLVPIIGPRSLSQLDSYLGAAPPPRSCRWPDRGSGSGPVRPRRSQESTQTVSYWEKPGT